MRSEKPQRETVCTHELITHTPHPHPHAAHPPLYLLSAYPRRQARAARRARAEGGRFRDPAGVGRRGGAEGRTGGGGWARAEGGEGTGRREGRRLGAARRPALRARGAAGNAGGRGAFPRGGPPPAAQSSASRPSAPRGGAAARRRRRRQDPAERARRKRGGRSGGRRAGEERAGRGRARGPRGRAGTWRGGTRRSGGEGGAPGGRAWRWRPGGEAPEPRPPSAQACARASIPPRRPASRPPGSGAGPLPPVRRVPPRSPAPREPLFLPGVRPGRGEGPARLPAGLGAPGCSPPFLSRPAGSRDPRVPLHPWALGPASRLN